MIKRWIVKLFAPLLFKMYKEEIIRVISKAGVEQMTEVQNLITEATENGLDLYVEINPNLVAPIAISTGSYEEEDTPNPFSLVDNDEEE